MYHYLTTCYLRAILHPIAVTSIICLLKSLTLITSVRTPESSLYQSLGPIYGQGYDVIIFVAFFKLKMVTITIWADIIITILIRFIDHNNMDTDTGIKPISVSQTTSVGKCEPSTTSIVIYYWCIWGFNFPTPMSQTDIWGCAFFCCRPCWKMAAIISASQVIYCLHAEYQMNKVLPRSEDLQRAWADSSLMDFYNTVQLFYVLTN